MSEEFLERQQTIREIVLDVLRRFQAARDSKELAVLIVLNEQCGLPIYVKPEQIERFFKIESILREMRKIQRPPPYGLGLYQPSIAEQIRRGWARMECHDAYAGSDET